MPAECARRLLRVAQHAYGFRKFWAHHQADDSGIGNEFVQQPESLGNELGTKPVNPRDVAARPVEADDVAQLDRVASGREHDRNRSGRCLSHQNRIAASGRGDYRHLAGDQIGCQRRQSIAAIFRKMVFDCHIAPFDVAGFTQATTERFPQFGPVIPPVVQKPDHRQRPLQRTRRDRPRDRRAAEKRNKLAPPHSITSSARATSVGETVRPSALAVLRLMNSSTFVACATGRSVGFSPLRIRPV